MNEVLSELAENYLDRGTGDILAYFSCDNLTVIEKNNLFYPTLVNENPASNIEHFSGYFGNGYVDPNDAQTFLENVYINEETGVNLSLTHIELDAIEFDEITFLFSYEKSHENMGILFGSLNLDDNLNFGRGFNVGINHRNHFFYQSLSADSGPHAVAAHDLELSRKNICSVAISPYAVNFTLYDLKNDTYDQHFLSTNNIIEPNQANESLYIGRSNHFLDAYNSFSGYLDELLILSGFHNSLDLKSIASGFVATGIYDTGLVYDDSVVTGFNIELIPHSGVTGYEPVITGYKDSITSSELLEFVLVQDFESTDINEGHRYITGYTLPNNSGAYLEETSFLVKTDQYQPSGDNPHATLGLQNEIISVNQYTISTQRIINVTGNIPIYEFQPVIGLLIDSSGYQKTFLEASISKTGDGFTALSLKNDLSQYKKDYLYYLQKRI